MAYDVADCAHNKVCTNCPSRIGCEVRKLFYNEEAYLRTRNYSYVRGRAAARVRGFSDSECEKLAEDSMVVMDHRRAEEMKLHPQYSET